jgi:protein tyrosine phosphatase (PTP) superfamily phosphohydrolase (DUF442 family)
MKRPLFRLLCAGLVLTLAGCCLPGCCNTRPVSQPIAPPSPKPVLPVYPAPVPPPGAYQAAPFPAVPPGSNIPPALPQTSPFPTVPPPALPPTSGAVVAPQQPIAQVEHRWTPADNGIQLGGPEPLAGAAPNASPRLYPPDKTAEPPINKSATALPVGIPQFATAMDSVTTGLRPSLDDGLDWLQAHGYRTVAQIRTPGENDTTDRKQVEKRGMKYMSVEVSPQTLTKAVVEEFTRLVRDKSAQPVFIYDRDGALAGALWYLYFRTIEQFPDDVARIRAGSLGLREDREGANRDMWLAVQKYLSENGR